ncbi:MAG: transglutaminase family protein [Acidobacteriota bacterium]|nr:transglutaminase family protein [Acidobacteriota bacterium]
MVERDAVREFASFVGRQRDRIPLLEAALMIARTEYPRLDLPAQLRRFEDLARRLDANPGYSPHANILALNRLLFEEEALTGNEQDYDNPQNSFLNDVLDRRKGIPITLSLIYVETGRRRGLPLEGVSFPGHFLAKYCAEDSEIYLDPFHRGEVLTLEDCEQLLRKHFGPDAAIQPEFLAACSAQQLLERMLNNLKGTYFRRNNYQRLLTIAEMSLALDPASTQSLLDRGMALFLLRRYREASADLRAYVALAPAGDPNMKSARAMLHRIRSLLN